MSSIVTRHSHSLTELVSRVRPSGRGQQESGLDGQLADIEARLAGVDRAELGRRLSWQLRPVVDRRVPPRSLEPAPVARAARLRFADGTTVVATGTHPGDLSHLLLAMHRGARVRPVACTTTPDGGTELRLVGLSRDLCLRITGLDQPD